MNFCVISFSYFILIQGGPGVDFGESFLIINLKLNGFSEEEEVY